jgi:hypothetical protein
MALEQTLPTICRYGRLSSIVTQTLLSAFFGAMSVGVRKADYGTMIARCILSESREQWVYDCNPVRVTDASVEALDLDDLGFRVSDPTDIGRPCYNPAFHFKFPIYGYLNRVQSSRQPTLTSKKPLEPPPAGRCMPPHSKTSDSAKVPLPKPDAPSRSQLGQRG